VTRFWLTRLARTAAVFLGVSVLVFTIMRMVPGDPAVLLLGSQASAEDLERLRQSLGLNQPLYVQFLRWLPQMLTGHLGTSIFTGQPVLTEVLPRLWASLELAAFGTGIGIACGLILGVISGARRYSLLDRCATFVAVFSISMPAFWLGLILIYVFSVLLRWFPSGGRGGLESLVLPGVAIATWTMGLVARMTRSGILETLGQEYVRTAKAKGGTEARVVYKHVLRNALLPVVTVLGVQFGVVLSSAVGVEIVFAWPGIAREIAQAILERDYPVIQAAVLIVAAVFVVANLVVDLLVGYLDPRIRYHA
jgi:ABC-type dipeptide/oligopeptide/nickel transport system permease component